MLGGALVALLLLSCAGEGRTSIGPVSIEVPEGWQVTRRTQQSLQIADGSAGGGTESQAGTATAVFDIFVNAPITAEEFRDQLLDQDIGASSEELVIDGHNAVVLSYTGEAVAGSQEAVFIPDRSVQIVYRAAFPDDVTAFNDGRAAFRAAVRSIRIVEAA